ncbi:MAG: hypothetical protein JO055_07565 [Alphaproteobacteria bacterium]|nr:hypothetical protein [Alphaproteobacteria bacterium]
MSESVAKPPFDPGDQKQVQDRARQAKDRQRESDQAIKAFMSHQAGRAWVWEQLSACGLFRLSARAGDAHMTYFYEGERNFGLRLLVQLQRACPELYATMAQENAGE